MLYVCECVSITDCVCYLLFFLLCYLCELQCMWMCVVYYKYNITLYNLIIRKYWEFVICVYIIIMLNKFCYEVSDSRTKIVKLVIV